MLVKGLKGPLTKGEQIEVEEAKWSEMNNRMNVSQVLTSVVVPMGVHVLCVVRGGGGCLCCRFVLFFSDWSCYRLFFFFMTLLFFFCFFFMDDAGILL